MIIKKIKSMFVEDTWIDRLFKNTGWKGVYARIVGVMPVYLMFYYFPEILSLFNEELTESRHKSYMLYANGAVIITLLIEIPIVIRLLKERKK